MNWSGFAFVFLTLYISSAATVFPSVKISDAMVRWKTFDYELSQDGTVTKYYNNRTSQKNFWVKIIENDLIKITLLPDFGGRVLSFIYKPTGREMLYQNPVGSVFGWKANNFYYNYLMVYGGIFPSFPEPEHGKAWNKPWEMTVLTNTREAVSVLLVYRDRSDRIPSTPLQFRYGRTDITCSVLVTVRDKSSVMEYTVSLENPREEYVEYEYWTCMTLAPGSVPGDTKSPGSTELVIPTKLVRLKSDWWEWMDAGNSGQPVQDNIFVLNRLTLYSNWQDMGIFYAYPQMTNSWYGVLNHDNQSGFFRVANNPRYTPGLKVWTWGYDTVTNINLNDGMEARRPFIEYWAGNSTEFFIPAIMNPRETRTWTEYYLPTAGISAIDDLNINGAWTIRVDQPSRSKVSTITVEFFSANPAETVAATMMLNGKKNSYLVYGRETALSPTGPVRLTAVITNTAVKRGVYELELKIQKKSGEILVKTTRTFIH